MSLAPLTERVGHLLTSSFCCGLPFCSTTSCAEAVLADAHNEVLLDTVDTADTADTAGFCGKTQDAALACTGGAASCQEQASIDVDVEAGSSERSTWAGESATESPEGSTQDPEDAAAREDEPGQPEPADAHRCDSASVDKGASEAARPDFSGTWVMRRVEGDMDVFLKDVGLSYMTRVGAKAARYGVGSMKCSITQSSGQLEVLTTSPLMSPFVIVQVLNGTEQKDTDPLTGKAVIMMSYWDGDAVMTDSRDAVSGNAYMPVRRWLEGNEMCVLVTSAKGNAIRRYFSRQ